MTNPDDELVDAALAVFHSTRGTYREQMRAALAVARPAIWNAAFDDAAAKILPSAARDAILALKEPRNV